MRVAFARYNQETRGWWYKLISEDDSHTWKPEKLLRKVSGDFHPIGGMAEKISTILALPPRYNITFELNSLSTHNSPLSLSTQNSPLDLPGEVHYSYPSPDND